MSCFRRKILGRDGLCINRIPDTAAGDWAEDRLFPILYKFDTVLLRQQAQLLGYDSLECFFHFVWQER